MSTAANTLDVVNGDGANTRIHYVMTSSGRKIQEGDTVLDGRLSSEDVDSIRQHLETNDGFKPDHVGIPDLVENMPISWSPTGDERHMITKISYTNSKSTAGAVDAENFASCFQEFDYKAALSPI